MNVNAKNPQTLLIRAEHDASSLNTVVRSRTVPGQAHMMRRRRLLSLAALAVVVMGAATVGGARASHDTNGLRARDAAIVAQSRAAVLDLYALDRRLDSAQAQLAALQQQESRLRAERAVLARQLQIARLGAQTTQAQLAKHLRVLYEQGNVEPLEIVFGAKSLEDAMTSIDNLTATARANRDVLRRLDAARQHLLETKQALSTRTAAITSARAEAQATVSALAGARAARSAYIASLARKRRLTESALARVVAESRAASIRSAAIVPVSQNAPPPELPAVGTSSGLTLTVSASGYSIHGRTSSGLPTGYGVVAVDPSVIPLGTHMTVPGYGEAVAADTGSAIIGARIDLWFPTLDQARAWGRRTVTIALH